MNFGMVALIVICAWALVSIVASVLVGGMASGRDVVEGPHRSVTVMTDPRRHGIRRAS